VRFEMVRIASIQCNAACRAQIVPSREFAATFVDTGHNQCAGAGSGWA
jgi:hypothetical protein